MKPLAARRSAVCLSAAAGALIGCLGTGQALAAGASSTVTPVQLQAESLAAARAQSAVHWVTSFTEGSRKLVLTTDAAKTTGLQDISLVDGSERGTVEIILANHTIYLRGSAFTLQSYMGFLPGAAAKEANRWMAMPSSVPDYRAVAAGLTVSSTVSELPMTGQLSLAPASVVRGVKVLAIRGTVAASAQSPAVSQVIYVRALGPPLPVEAVLSYKGITSATTFGPWGQPPPVVPPGKTIPFNSAWLQPG